MPVASRGTVNTRRTRRDDDGRRAGRDRPVLGVPVPLDPPRSAACGGQGEGRRRAHGGDREFRWNTPREQVPQRTVQDRGSGGQGRATRQPGCGGAQVPGVAVVASGLDGDRAQRVGACGRVGGRGGV
ncbi:hypothetical protein ACFFX0_00720 [Citricoccus parietis]|uniref:Uncharacterized protein n=1 Tax=Citricoccus parietis TaxID=592307 RepID=A0ABV5FSY6_9MICC